MTPVTVTTAELERLVLASAARRFERALPPGALDADFFDDLDGDSMTLMEIVMDVEEALGVEVPEADLDGLRSARDLIACLARVVRK